MVPRDRSSCQTYLDNLDQGVLDGDAAAPRRLYAYLPAALGAGCQAFLASVKPVLRRGKEKHETFAEAIGLGEHGVHFLLPAKPMEATACGTLSLTPPGKHSWSRPSRPLERRSVRFFVTRTCGDTWNRGGKAAPSIREIVPML